MEKLMDFGRFGKWSISTLLAQADTNLNTFRKNKLPYSIWKEKIEIESNIYRIKMKKIKKMDIGLLYRLMEGIKDLQKDLEQVDKISDIIIKEGHKRKK